MRRKYSALGLLALVLNAVLKSTLGNVNTIRSLMDGGQIFPRDVSRSEVAVRLSRVVNDGHKDDIEVIVRNYGFDNSDGIYLESGTDAVYLARVENKYCAATFRQTNMYQIGDLLTNVDLDPVLFEANNQNETNNNNTVGDLGLKDCEMHRGYHDAYVNFEYRDAVEEFLSDCRFDCEECETSLAGSSQGGAIAEIAALYMKETMSNHSPYVITFGSPQGLGAPCANYFSDSEKQRWFRYIMSKERLTGGKLVYDPVPLLYPQLFDPPEGTPAEDGFWDNFKGYWEMDETYARNGGLAYIGHEILISDEDPSSVLLSEYNGHRFVDLGYADLTLLAHYNSLYAKVLQTQEVIYSRIAGNCKEREKSPNNSMDENSLECPIPSSGFVAGTLCNPDERESTCANGTICKEEIKNWFWERTRYSCQLRPIPSSRDGSTVAPSDEGTATEDTDEALATIAPTASPSILETSVTSEGYRIRIVGLSTLQCSFIGVVSLVFGIGH